MGGRPGLFAAGSRCLETRGGCCRGARARRSRPRGVAAAGGARPAARAEEVAGLVVDKIALGEVIGDAGGVIHMPVREEDVFRAEHVALAAANVEGQVHLREHEEGLLAGQREAHHADSVMLDFKHTWCHGGVITARTKKVPLFGRIRLTHIMLGGRLVITTRRGIGYASRWSNETQAV